jgi:CheY-like chemotaxis protein
MKAAEKRYRVLIVDDEAPMRMLIAHCISEAMPAQVSLAGTCERALRMAEELTFDIILLDLLMPGIGGFEVLKHIRADSVNKSTPVIVVSVLSSAIAGDPATTYERAVALGANAFVSKPLTRNGLVSAVKAQLGVPA